MEGMDSASSAVDIGKVIGVMFAGATRKQSDGPIFGSIYVERDFAF